MNRSVSNLAWSILAVAVPATAGVAADAPMNRGSWNPAWPVLAAAAPATTGAAADAHAEERFVSLVTSSTDVFGEPLRAPATLRRFYEARNFRRAWTGEAGARISLDSLLEGIGRAGDHGLDPDDYHRAALRAAREREAADAVELLATDAYLTLAAHLLGGRLDPVSIEPSWNAGRRERDLAAHLEQALEGRRIAASLTELEPNAEGYAVLKRALAGYRKAARAGGWPQVPAGPLMRRGETGERVAALRERLHAAGLLADDEPPSQPDVFDERLKTAVVAFQRRAGIEADGVVGPATLAELNLTPQDRVDQIRVNLERWRWLAEELGRRHIRVNIADYRLEARRDGGIERVHEIVVGRPYRMTPVFSDRMTFLVFNPWWIVPSSIARKDKLPAFRRDPESVVRLGYEVLDAAGKSLDPATVDWSVYTASSFPLRLRQRPGPHNALGQVKMMFPNPHDVYLHDTPSRELFARSGRAFSSGCVRVGDPLALAAWVLAETPGWGRERIDAAVASGNETRVNLSEAVPIHILYFTAIAEPDGSLRFVNDVYRRDPPVIAALSAPASGAR